MPIHIEKPCKRCSSATTKRFPVPSCSLILRAISGCPTRPRRCLQVAGQRYPPKLQHTLAGHVARPTNSYKPCYLLNSLPAPVSSSSVSGFSRSSVFAFNVFLVLLNGQSDLLLSAQFPTRAENQSAAQLLYASIAKSALTFSFRNCWRQIRAPDALR